LGAVLDGPERRATHLSGPPRIETAAAIRDRALTLFAAGQQRDALILLFDTLGRLTAQERASAAYAPVRAVLASLLESVAVSFANETILEVLACLANDSAISAQSLAPTMVALLVARPESAALRSPAESVVTDAARDLLAHPLVPLLLPRIVIGSRAGEAWATDMRRALAHRALDPAFLGQRWLWAGVDILGATALNGEYAWAETDDETAMVSAMGEALTDALAHDTGNASIGALAPVLLTYALYRRLTTIPGWERLALHPDAVWGELAPTMLRLVYRQVRDRLEEQRLAAALDTLANTDDDGSRRVRAQYETHPYPRWVTAPTARATSIAAFARELRPRTPAPAGQRILIAGCGTGRQIVQLAASFPSASITAFDLSAASLGYAARMLNALRVPNVRLLHGDLLALETLDEQFDLISCSGVLHHLVNPHAGWTQLVQRLAPHGLMKIGLYSTTARACVRAARDVVAAHGVPTRDDELRRARQTLLALPLTHAAAPATESLDFYSLSGFRDLVVHVQERSYTIPEIASELRQLRLEFLGFQLPRDVQSRFVAMHPHPNAALDLAAWDAFEQAHPLTFWGMYQFWCGPAR
jgi:SAM-dependent methyltransferase